MNLTVVGPRVFVRPDKLPEMTSDGRLHIVRDNSESTMTGVVVAVGDGAEFTRRAYLAGYRDGTAEACGEPYEPDVAPEQEHVVNVGERVVFAPQAGEELFFEKDLLICMKEDDIMAVIN
jgi:co-chaperonin GroES (HSP10)